MQGNFEDTKWTGKTKTKKN